MRARAVAPIVVLALALAALPAGASHDTGTYTQPVWFAWDRTDLDVIVVPPEHGQVLNGNGVGGGDPLNEVNPLASSYLRAIENSIADWDRAILQWGSPALQTVRTTVYVLGRDPVPPSVLGSPEIVVATDQTKLFILGVAVRTGITCLVDNSKFFVTSFGYQDMFNVNAQEYGHCLGLQHVPGHRNDLNGIPGDKHDPMNGNYPDSPGSATTDLHCVSNLNVAGLELVFQEALGGPPAAQVAAIPISAYQRPATTSACHM